MKRFVLGQLTACFGYRRTTTARACDSSTDDIYSMRGSSAKARSRTTSVESVLLPERLSIRVSSAGEHTSRSRRSWVREVREAANGTPISPKTFTKRKSFVSNARLVKVLKRDSDVRRRFESYAEKQYASENVAFVKSVLEWKATGRDRTQAQRILETYILISAPHQVNLSCAVRTNIEGIFDAKSGEHIPATVFDQATREISNMMVDGGIWGTFVWKGGIDTEVDDTYETRSSAREGSSAMEITLI